MKTRRQQTLAKARIARRPKKGAAAPGGKAAPRKARERRAPEDRTLALAAECTVAQAEALKGELERRLRESAPVTLDVVALQRIDTAGLQLLAAFVRDRRTAGLAVEWRGRASALEAAAGLLGLNEMLGLAGEVGR